MALALLVTACGGSSTNASDQQGTQAAQAGTTPAPVSSVPAATATSPSATSRAPTTGAFVADKTWTWTAHTNTGYKASFKVQAGKPVSASNAPLLPGFTSSSDITTACSDFNAQTDALLPVEVVITNNTPKFDATVEFDASVTDPNGAPPYTLSTIDDVSQQIQCSASSDTLTGYSFSCQLQTGTNCTTSAYIVIEGYYSPSKPGGNPDWLNQMELMIQAGDGGMIYAITAPSGPGATIQQFGGQNAELDIMPL